MDIFKLHDTRTMCIVKIYLSSSSNLTLNIDEQSMSQKI